MNSNPVERVLSLLEGVRESSTGQYKALCPAHDDKSPTLSVTEKDDRVLIHCFAGCETGDVLDALGLRMSDLFVNRDTHGPIPVRDRWNARAMLRELSDESAVVLIAAADMLQQKPLPPEDHKRLRKAADRIARIVEITS